VTCKKEFGCLRGGGEREVEAWQTGGVAGSSTEMEKILLEFPVSLNR
jgi:hypothetical protein